MLLPNLLVLFRTLVGVILMLFESMSPSAVRSHVARGRFLFRILSGRAFGDLANYSSCQYNVWRR